MPAVTRAGTAAAGAFAPGHLGELTQYLPFELVDAALEETRTVQRRLRELPSRVGVHFVLALAMFPGLGYARVWGKLIAGLAGTGSGTCQLNTPPAQTSSAPAPAPNYAALPC